MQHIELDQSQTKNGVRGLIAPATGYARVVRGEGAPFVAGVVVVVVAAGPVSL